MTQCVKVSVGGGKGERGELADQGGGEFRDPVDISTGQGTKESGDGGRAKGTMMVGDKTCKGERAQREKGGGGGGKIVRLRCREEPQVGVGGFGAGKKGDGRVGFVVDFDRGGSEDGHAMGAD